MADILDFIPVVQETSATIRARLDADLNAGLDPADPAFQDTTPGGWWYDWSQPVVLEIERAYDTMGTDVVAASLPAFAWGDNLDEQGLTVGVERNDASASQGEVTFTGSDGTLVAVGAQVATTQTDPDADPIVYATTESGTIAGGTLTLAVAAVTPGVAGNVAAGSVNVLLSAILGVSAVTNALSMTGGADVETDDKFRERVLLEWQAAHGGGTIADYEKFALDYPGVGFVKVVPLAQGPGTVGVIITDVENKPLADAVVEGLQDELDPPQASTMLTLGETLPAAIINVDDTTGFDALGRVRIAGQVVSYTAKKPQIAPPGALTAAVGAATGLTGIYLYKVTFVTAEGETNGGVESAPVTVANQKINLSAIPVGPAGTTARKIYRTVAGGLTGTEHLVTTIADNTTLVFVDNVADGSLTTAVPVANSTAAFTGGTGGAGVVSAGETIEQAGKGEGEAPIGALVVVTTPIVTTIDVASTLTHASGYSLTGAGGTIATGDDVTAAIQEYLNSLAPGDDVVIKKIEAQVFLVPGVADVTALTIDGGGGPVTVNIAIADSHVAESGLVVLS